MSYKQFAFRQKHLPNMWLDTPRKRIYNAFITEISCLMVSGYDWALIKAWQADSDGWLEYDTIYEWSWIYGFDCLSNLNRDLLETEEIGMRETQDELGDGYYLVTLSIDYEQVEEDDGISRVEYLKCIDSLVKFISVDEIEGAVTNEFPF